LSGGIKAHFHSNLSSIAFVDSTGARFAFGVPDLRSKSGNLNLGLEWKEATGEIIVGLAGLVFPVALGFNLGTHVLIEEEGSLKIRKQRLTVSRSFRAFLGQNSGRKPRVNQLRHGQGSASCGGWRRQDRGEGKLGKKQATRVVLELCFLGKKRPLEIITQAKTQNCNSFVDGTRFTIRIIRFTCLIRLIRMIRITRGSRPIFAHFRI